MAEARGESGEEKQASIKAWHSYISEDLPRSFNGILDQTRLLSFRESIPDMKLKLHTYEDAFFRNFKDGLATATEYPTVALGITLASTFLIATGPRRFLLRHTVGRLQNEEARFVRAERNMNLLNISVDLMKKESRKLLERTTFAEKEMRNGQAHLMSIGKQIQRHAKSVNHVESQAAELMNLLREIPGREALRLRAEVASVASLLKHQRTDLEKRMSKFSDVGAPL